VIRDGEHQGFEFAFLAGTIQNTPCSVVNSGSQIRSIFDRASLFLEELRISPDGSQASVFYGHIVVTKTERVMSEVHRRVTRS